MKLVRRGKIMWLYFDHGDEIVEHIKTCAEVHGYKTEDDSEIGMRLGKVVIEDEASEES